MGSKQFLLMSCGLAALCAGPAWGQQAAAGDDTAVLEEIIVTAEKRASTVQRTPAAITAFSGEALEDRNLTSAADLNGVVPNVQIGSLTREMSVSVRGVSSANVPPAQDASVGIHLDGVFMTRPSGANSVFFDLERVEVLRGPQGTLYGRNTTAGAVNIISRKPVFETEGAAEVGFGNYQALSTRGMLNVPLVDDRVALRAAFATNRHDGYQKNVIQDGPDLADLEETAARAHLLFLPSEALRVLLSANYYKRGGAGGSHVNNGTPGYDPYKANVNAPYRLNNRGYGFVADVTYSLENFDIVSLSSYRRDRVDVRYARVTGVPNTGSVRLWNPNETFSEELRIATTWDAPFSFVAGAYYMDERNEDNVDFYVNNAQTGGFNQLRPNVDATTAALFAQGDLRLTDTLKLTAGGRYSKDKKKDIGGTISNIGGAVVNTPNLRGEWDEVTWRVGADWEVAPAHMLYANVSTGYKAGGVGPIANFDPETVLAYEVGSKNRLLDGRATLNLAAFYYDYDDLQQTSVILNGTTATGLTTNAAKAEVYGAEVEASAQLTPQLRIDASAAYLKAEFLSFPAAFDAINGVTVNLTGNRLPRAPEWQFTLGAEYAFELEPGTLTARADLRYSSDVFFSHFNDTAYPVGGVLRRPYATAAEGDFTRTNLSLRYQPREASWYAEAYVQNLEDDAVIDYAQVTAAAATAGFASPRLYGIKIGATF
ncbi:MAG TPA: TonB-dependent receptor [Azospirillaceae bacterium]|nr:TonB-dependent receptor [Azospirillaceae bacterium]